jgi:hypothetical protein
VLRLVLELNVSVAEYDEVRSILEALKGTEVTQGRAGILQIDDSGLELRVGDGAAAAFAELPEVLVAAARRLTVLSEGPDGEKAKRALFHLYEVTRGGGR